MSRIEVPPPIGVSTENRHWITIWSLLMNATAHSFRRVLLLTLFSAGLAAASLAEASPSQFVGPRNTIPRAQTAEATERYSSEQLRASMNGASTCTLVRIKHQGHPSKGIDRVERIEVPCGRARLSVR